MINLCNLIYREQREEKSCGAIDCCSYRCIQQQQQQQKTSKGMRYMDLERIPSCFMQSLYPLREGK